MILSNNNEYIINYSLRSLSYSGGGCDYNNKYEIPTYGSKSRDKIQIRVRHYQDSYIAAEEITKGCSSTNIYETNCISNTVSTQRKPHLHTNINEMEWDYTFYDFYSYIYYSAIDGLTYWFSNFVYLELYSALVIIICACIACCCISNNG